jgi:hypothetical protein
MPTPVAWKWHGPRARREPSASEPQPREGRRNRGGGRNRTAVRGFAGALPGFVAVHGGPSHQVIGQTGPWPFMNVPLRCGITVAWPRAIQARPGTPKASEERSHGGVPQGGLDEPDGPGNHTMVMAGHYGRPGCHQVSLSGLRVPSLFKESRQARKLDLDPFAEARRRSDEHPVV